MKLTLQNSRLPWPVLAGNLHCSALDKIQTHAVGQLLNLNIRDIWLTELAHVEPPDTTWRAGKAALHHGKYKEALRVEGHVASLPEEGIGELDVHVAHLGGDARLASSCRWSLLRGRTSGRRGSGKGGGRRLRCCRLGSLLFDGGRYSRATLASGGVGKRRKTAHQPFGARWFVAIIVHVDGGDDGLAVFTKGAAATDG